MWLRYALLGAGTLPLWALVPYDVPILGGGASFISSLLFETCQNDPERALSVFSVQLSCCARCTGLYLGVGLGALILRPRFGRSALWLWFSLGLVVMALDVVTELLWMRPPEAWLRCFTGVFLAYPASLLGLLGFRDAPQPSAARLDPKPQ